MASGTPVAAYPVDGPLEVLCKAGGDDSGVYYGGVLRTDLQQACYTALTVPRHEARLRALDFSWAQAAQLFEGFLVLVHQDRPMQNGQGLKNENSENHVTRLVENPVTPLS
jgi:hypothetical protein